MKQFTDELGRGWEVVVNTATAKRVRDLVGVEILKLYAEEAERVLTDPILLVDVLYVLCRAQCEARGMSDEQFGAAMVGEPIERGAMALMEAVADFFPPAKAQLLRKIKEKGELAGRRILGAAMQLVEKLDPTSGGSSTGSPEPSASTPTP